MDIEDKYKYAGFWKRAMAVIIDSLVITIARAIVAGVIILITIGFLYLFDVESPYTRRLVFIILSCLGFIGNIYGVWLYHALLESSPSQATLGKMALGIKVTGLDGERITFERATARHFGKLLSYASIFIGYLMAGFSSQKQALHDVITKCIVVDKYWS